MSTTLARKFAVDVTLDTTLATGWVHLNGIFDLDPEIASNLEDTTAYDTSGWSTSEVTLYSWTLAASFYRRATGNTYDAGQELVRNVQGGFQTAARVGVRWFDRNGGPEAYSGVAVIGWKRTNTAAKDVEQAVATFTGTDIALNLNITNPYTTALVPVVTGITPTGLGAAKAVAITGANFTGATGVTFGGVAATSFSFQNDQLITAVIPTGSAGTITVVVTNATGPSVQTNNYVRTT